MNARFGDNGGRVRWGWMRSHDGSKNGSCRFNLLTWGVRHLSVPMGHVSVGRRMWCRAWKGISRNPQPTRSRTVSPIDRQSNLIQNVFHGVPSLWHFKARVWGQHLGLRTVPRASWRTDAIDWFFEKSSPRRTREPICFSSVPSDKYRNTTFGKQCLPSQA
jgi:hypothetical protein